ncbi:MAG: DinB family protein [Flavobacteriaceae bacterium]|nr:DinB family protein [Flavobacteriaceae bacterium]
MEPHQIIDKLKNNQAVFQSLLVNKSTDEILWRPQPEKWNLLEIVCHLYDEEREDFRARVRHVLHTPNEKMKPYDPLALVESHAYAKKDYPLVLDDFLKERENSIAWLGSLENPKWDNVYNHPKLGKMSAFLFLTNWLAHDYLHLRQILRYQYLFLIEKTNMNLQYAGTW